METILGLLLLLLPAIFKLIEKKLQTSGKEEQAKKVRDFTDIFKEDESSSSYEGDESAFEESAEPMAAPAVELPRENEPVPLKRVESETVGKTVSFFNVEGQKVIRKKKAPVILLEEPQIKKKEKIDPKKMVIYSEIMKPKYQD